MTSSMTGSDNMGQSNFRLDVHLSVETVYQIILMSVLFDARADLASLLCNINLLKRDRRHLSDGEALSLVAKCNPLSI